MQSIQGNTIDSFFVPPETQPEEKPSAIVAVGESNTGYHADHSHFGNSNIGVFRQSRQKFHGRFIAHTLPAPAPTADMQLGTHVHTAALESDRFAALEVFAERCEATKKDGQQCSNAPLGRNTVGHWLCGVHGKGHDMTIPDAICKADKDRAQRLADALYANKEARRWLWDEEGVNEVSIRWQDRLTGIKRKCRPDRWLQKMNVIVDLKTTDDAHPASFAKKAANLGYHRQCSWYQDGVEATGAPRPAFVFVVIARDEPHDIGIYELDESAITLARYQNETALRELSGCLKRNDWREQWQKQVVKIALPKYAEYADEYDIIS